MGLQSGDKFVFVHDGVEVPAKRLVVWIEEPLHRAIKAEAVTMGVDMGAVISSIVKSAFAEGGVYIDWPDPEKADAG